MNQVRRITTLSPDLAYHCFQSPNVLKISDSSLSRTSLYLIVPREFDDPGFYHGNPRATIHLECLMKNLNSRFPEKLDQDANSILQLVQRGFGRRNLTLPETNVASGMLPHNTGIEGFSSSFPVQLKNSRYTNTLLDILGIPHPRHLENFGEVRETLERIRERKRYFQAA